MAPKSQGMVAELQKLMEEKKVALGTDRTQKLLQQGKLAKVMVTRNCPQQLRDLIAHTCAVSNVEFVELQQSNEELGILCRKPFAISMLGVVA